MAKRKNKIRHDEETRTKIQTTQLIKRLESHILGKLKKPLEASQVTAALGLLKKTLPDLVATEVKGDIFNHHYVVSGNPMDEDEWKNKYESGVEPTAGASKSTH